MKRLIILFVLFTVLLIGCAPQVVATPTAKPTSKYEIFEVTKGTGLYASCGDADADTLAELPEGTELYAFQRANELDCCKFEDAGMEFELCHMEVVSTGQVGWVLKKWIK